MNKTQEIKAALTTEFPSVKFSVRKTRNNGWVGQVIGIKFDTDSMTKEQWTDIFLTAHSFDDYAYTIEIESDYAGRKTAAAIN